MKKVKMVLLSLALLSPCYLSQWSHAAECSIVKDASTGETIGWVCAQPNNDTNVVVPESDPTRAWIDQLLMGLFGY